MSLGIAVLEFGWLLLITSAALIFLPTLPTHWPAGGELAWMALPSACSCTLSYYYNDLYNPGIVKSFRDFCARLPQALLLAAILLAVYFLGASAFQHGQGDSRHGRRPPQDRRRAERWRGQPRGASPFRSSCPAARVDRRAQADGAGIPSSSHHRRPHRATPPAAGARALESTPAGLGDRGWNRSLRANRRKARCREPTAERGDLFQGLPQVAVANRGAQGTECHRRGDRIDPDGAAHGAHRRVHQARLSRTGALPSGADRHGRPPFLVVQVPHHAAGGGGD